MPGQTVIVGLGSPVRSDDGVGLRIIEHLQASGVPDHVDLVAAGTPGLGILDLITGYSRAVIVDAIDAGAEPGTIIQIDLKNLQTPASAHTSISHGIDLETALEAGRRLGLPLPGEIHIVAVQIEDATTLSETLTPAVDAAVEAAASKAIEAAIEKHPTTSS